MFICVPDHLKNNVTDVSPGHWRIKAVILKNYDKKILIVILYLPVDKNINILNTEGENDELSETTSIIDNVIDNNECDALIIAGDLNCDFSKNTKHT